MTDRPRSRRRLARVPLVVLLWAFAATGVAPPGEPASPPADPAPARALPPRMEPCRDCHHWTVEGYLEHGMARSLGPLGEPPRGTVVNPVSGNRYRITTESDGPWLETTRADGGRGRQPLVGRIGAGLYDTSWVTAEVDPVTGEGTGRLFFAPVETLTEGGLTLAPFDLHEGSPGPEMPLTGQCLGCHTLDPLSELPGAAVAGDSSEIYPPNALGADAFLHLQPLTCEACHGDTSRHLAIITGELDATGDDIGLVRLGELAPGAQRDRCARCHLQGDARFELATEAEGADLAAVGSSVADQPLAGLVPTLVPAAALDDFRFVGQLERLALSACFRASPSMTCTTCHQPHQGVASQGTASFDEACVSCHPDGTGHPPRTAEESAGTEPRTELGCVDCHVRRGQPFDLPHVRTADHFIRRRIAPPRGGSGHREHADPSGPLAIFDDSRLADVLATEGGRRWRDGILAMGLLTRGQAREAAGLFDRFPRPGSEAARTPTGSPGLTPLETDPSFHQARAMALMATGRSAEAMAAFGDALALDPQDPGVRISRARLSLATGNLLGVLLDTEEVIGCCPRAEAPWDLRAELAWRRGSPEMVIRALTESVSRRPTRAEAWLELGRAYRQLDQPERAIEALRRAERLRPSLEGLAEELAALETD